MAAVGVVGAAVVDEGGLEERVEGFAIGGCGEPLEALVVGASGLGVLGYEGAVGVVDWGAGGGEGDGTVAVGEEGGWGLDCGEELAGFGEVVDVGPVLVADPVAAVFGEDEAFGVDANTLASGAGLAEAVAGVCCGGEEGKVADGEAARWVSFEAGRGVAGGVAQESRALVGEM